MFQAIVSRAVVSNSQKRKPRNKRPINISLHVASAFPLLCLCLAGCDKPEEHHHAVSHKVVVTTPAAKDVVSTQEYVCQIHSSRHIEVRALEGGYLEAIPVKEGQTVKQGETLFQIVPTLYKAKLDAELAELQLAQIELANTQRLLQQNVISKPEVSLAEAKLAKSQAKVALARAELNFATVKAPFDGIIDHQRNQQGSLIAEGDILTTLSDNNVMWVYFNVPERDYLKYMKTEDKSNLIIELELADGKKFSQAGKIGALEADFNNETGNIKFRADFPNPEGLLRHGQTGKIFISRILQDAIVIPQRATFEILAKKYAFVVTASEKKHDAEGPVEHGDEHGGEHKVELDVSGQTAGLRPITPQDDAQNESKHHGVHAEDQVGEPSAVAHNREFGVVHQREIIILSERDDIFLIKDGLGVNDKIILEGIRQVRDGEEVEYEFLAPEQALDQLKYHAE